jgi:hypothetical protein
MRVSGLADLSDTGHLHDWGLLLPICKANGLVMIRVLATKCFAVFVKHGHLPMPVFSALIFPEDRVFSSFHLRNTITLNGWSHHFCAGLLVFKPWSGFAITLIGLINSKGTGWGVVRNESHRLFPAPHRCNYADEEGNTICGQLS